MNRPQRAGARRGGAGVSSRKSDDRPGVIAAYREGLGLAAIVVISGPAGIAIVAAGHADGDAPATETVLARWWCRRADDAERVAMAANARLRRLKSHHGAPFSSAALTPLSGEDSAALPLIWESIARAARQCNVALQSDQALSDEAMAVIRRVDDEIERMKRSGELRSVNKSYQKYRIEASEQGERVLRYPEWMGKYREDLVRKLAAALRYL
jgi:hypothetical protein